MLTSTIGLGAIIGGVWLAQRGEAQGLTRIVLAAMGAAGAAVLGFALSHNLWTALPCVAMAGFLLVICGVGVQTLLQTAVDGSMRGRVLSLYGILFRAGPAFGALAMGGASELVGLALPLAIGCVLSTGLALFAWQRRATIAHGLEAPG